MLELNGPQEEISSALSAFKRNCSQKADLGLRLNAAIKILHDWSAPYGLQEVSHDAPVGEILYQVNALPREKRGFAITHWVYHSTPPSNLHQALIVYLLDKTECQEIRIVAAISIGRLLSKQNDHIVIAHLKSIMLDNEEVITIREAVYFAILNIKGIEPFPEDKLGEFNEQYDAFRFPEDVVWKHVFS